MSWINLENQPRCVSRHNRCNDRSENLHLQLHKSSRLLIQPRASRRQSYRHYPPDGHGSVNSLRPEKKQKLAALRDFKYIIPTAAAHMTEFLYRGQRIRGKHKISVGGNRVERTHALVFLRSLELFGIFFFFALSAANVSICVVPLTLGLFPRRCSYAVVFLKFVFFNGNISIAQLCLTG